MFRRTTGLGLVSERKSAKTEELKSGGLCSTMKEALKIQSHSHVVPDFKGLLWGWKEGEASHHIIATQVRQEQKEEALTERGEKE